LLKIWSRNEVESCSRPVTGQFGEWPEIARE